MSTKAKSQFPSGWDEARVKALIDHYDNQTEEEAIAEAEAAFESGTLMVVPPGMVIEIENFIAKRQKERGKKKPRAS